MTFCKAINLICKAKIFYYWRVYFMNEVIKTERLIIDKFEKNDWKDLHEYLSNEDVVQFEPYDLYTEEQALQEAERRAENAAFWAVRLKETKKLIGNIYLEKGHFDTWELGYVFNKEYWGNYYATESAFAVVDYAFKVKNARRIIAMCNPLNNSSWRLLERLGMRREGHLVQNIYFKQDSQDTPIWCDTYEYGILKNEWLSK